MQIWVSKDPLGHIQSNLQLHFFVKFNLISLILTNMDFPLYFPSAFGLMKINTKSNKT